MQPPHHSSAFPFVLLPDAPSLFARRAARCRELGQGHATLGSYLAWLGQVADVQSAVAASVPSAALVQDGGETAFPLALDRLPWDGAWMGVLDAVLDGIERAGGVAGATAARLRQSGDVTLRGLAENVLSAEFDGLDSAVVALLAAGLQVRWSWEASRLDAAAIARQQSSRLCPRCGSYPVASVLQTGGALQGLRFLTCSLCASQWYRERIHCTRCGSSKEVSYYGIEGREGAVRAEACEGCRGYLKVLDREKAPGLDPVADDIASLALDLLMAEAGYERLGVNFFLILGAGESTGSVSRGTIE